MKIKNLIIIPVSLIILNCYSVPEKISLGEWKYKLYVNGVDVGTAVISNKVADSNYISSSEYNMKLADMNTIARDTVTETMDFKPVRLESYNKIVNAGKIHETNIVSVFKGNNVELTFGNKKYNYTINKDFIIDGNYFMSKLIQAKFKKGYEISSYVYNPSVELETPIKATTKVIGNEKVMIKGEELELIHISQSIENIKDNIDLYIDSNCILQKGLISMLNLKIELVKI